MARAKTPDSELPPHRRAGADFPLPAHREPRGVWRTVRAPGGSPVTDSGGYFPVSHADKTGILPGTPGFRVFQGFRGTPGFTGYGTPSSGTVVAHIGNVCAILDAVRDVVAPPVADAGLSERELPESGKIPYQGVNDKSSEAWKSWRDSAPRLRAEHEAARWHDRSREVSTDKIRERLGLPEGAPLDRTVGLHASPRPSWEDVCQRARELWRAIPEAPPRIAREAPRGAKLTIGDDIRAVLALTTVNMAPTNATAREDDAESPATCYALVANGKGYSVRAVWQWGRTDNRRGMPKIEDGACQFVAAATVLADALSRGHTHITEVSCRYCGAGVCPAALRPGSQCPKTLRFPALLAAVATARREHREAKTALANVIVAPARTAMETCHAAYRFALANSLSDDALANCERDARGAASALKTAEKALSTAIAPYAAAIARAEGAVIAAVAEHRAQYPDDAPAASPHRPVKVNGRMVRYPPVDVAPRRS